MDIKRALTINNEPFASFYENNKDFDILAFDFYNKEAVSELDFDGVEKESLLAELRAYQRLLRVEPDVEAANKLLSVGLDSAHRIAVIPEHQFVRKYSDLFGGDEEKTRQVHQKAVGIKAFVKHLFANIHSMVASPHYRAMPANNVSAGVDDYFQEIPSYQDLFGGLNYCKCEHCRSIFGPAAYFLDIMRITDDYITDPNTTKPTDNIPPGFTLQERRPDLFDLKLDCANTNELVPFLQIVNNILEARIVWEKEVATGTAQSGGVSSITLAQTASPDDAAYSGMIILITAGTGVGQFQTITSYTGSSRVASVSNAWTIIPDSTSHYSISENPYQTLAAAPYPFNLPFNLPLVQTRRYLKEMDTTLSSIYTRFNPIVAGGQAQGGTVNTIMLAGNASSEDGVYNTMQIFLVGGEGAGETRVINAYDGNSKQATVSRPWLVTPDATTQYHILNQLGTAREDAGLSIEQYDIVTTPVIDPDKLAPFYGYQSLDLSTLSKVEVFTERTGLSRERLNELLTQHLSYQELNDKLPDNTYIADYFYINDTGENLPYMRIAVNNSDQNNPFYEISNLSVKRLDRLNRFIRLAARLKWGYAELNWALVSIRAVATGQSSLKTSEIDEASIKSIAGIKRLQEATGLDVTTLCSFWSDLKTIGRGNGPNPLDLFDTIFNNPALLRGQNPYTSVATIPFDPYRPPLLWTIDDTTGMNGVIRGRLLGALAISDDNLTVLAEFVSSLLGLLDQPLPLSNTNLTWLYRLSKAAATFKMTIDEYLLLLGLMYFPESDYRHPPAAVLIPTIEGGLAQKEKVDWFKTTRLTVYSTLYILKGIQTPYYKASYQVGQIAPLIENLSTISEGARITSNSFVFGDIDEEHSGRIFSELIEDKFITDIGIILDSSESYQAAADQFPLTANSFVTVNIDQQEAERVFAQLQNANPPILIPVPQTENCTVSQYFYKDTNLDFLFVGEPDAANKRNEVRTILLETKKKIYVTEFAFLFTLNEGSFITGQITPEESARAFQDLADHAPPIIIRSPASGQQRTITSYDGVTKTATVSADWNEVPNDTSIYEIINTVDQGQAQGGSVSSITLAATASPVAGAYNGQTVEITGGTGEGQASVIVAYDGASKVATVANGWATVPDATSVYSVTEVVNAGAARGATQNTIELDAAASSVNDQYAHMTVSIIKYPEADIKRGDVKMTLLDVRQDIEHSAGVVEEAGILQEGNAAQGLADFLRTTPDRLTALIPFASETTNLTDYLDTLLTPIKGGQVPAELPPFIEALSRALVLLNALGFTVEEMFAVVAMPQAFNIDNLYDINFDNIQALSIFKGLENAFNDQDNGLIAYFQTPVEAGCPNTKVAELSALTHWNVNQICQLINLFWPEGEGKSYYDYTTVVGVFRLKQSFDICQQTGLDVNSMLQLDSLSDLPLVNTSGQIIPASWLTYNNLAAMVLGAVNAKFNDEEFASVDQGITSYLNEQKRDALLGFTIWLLNQNPELKFITSPSALYQYLLIDVEMSGCDSTSYIAQAISSVQLYMQRCLMMLEPGVTDMSNIPEVWWEWMSTYRVWEANRKIFLYPENYVDPSLRQYQTPQFEEFNESLFQTDITDNTVSEAFQNYFDGFSVVANLVNTDSYSCTVRIPGTKVTYAQGTAKAGAQNTITLADNASVVYNYYADMRVKITTGTGQGQTNTITKYDGNSRIATVAKPWTTVPDSTSTYVITGEAQIKRIYFIGRTNTQPYTYYYRQFDDGIFWTPWQEVGISINSMFATPAYAFSRLFLLWSELKTVDSSTVSGKTNGSLTVDSTTITSVISTLKYSYLNNDGTWIQPQVIKEEVVVDYEKNYTLDTYVALNLPNLPGVTPATYSGENIFWQKVYGLVAPEKSINNPDKYPNYENIFLNYGYSVQYSRTPPISQPTAPPTNIPPYQYLIEDAMYEMIRRYNVLRQGVPPGVAGYLPNLSNLSLDSSLNSLSLDTAYISNQAFLDPLPYYPTLNRPNNKLDVNDSITYNPIIDNYNSDNYAQIPIIVPDSPKVNLLSNVSGQAASVILVKNVVGRFILDNGDESFAVFSSDKGVQNLSDVLVAAANYPPYPAGEFYFYAYQFTSTRPYPVPANLQYIFYRISTTVVSSLNQKLIRGGIPYLLSLESQLTPELPFSRLAPNLNSVIPPLSDTLDFNGAYGPYFWEVFFYAPFLVASTLNANKQFSDAKTWYEYIYNPTQQPDPEDLNNDDRYWRFLPFRTMTIPTLTQILTNPAQILVYNDDPFNPDAIARLRTVSYAKAIVMRYIKNLIDWGDMLFTQDTRESITQATNLYVLAANLLGKRPEAVGECPAPEPMSYNEIKEEYNDKTVTTGTAQAGSLISITLASTASSEDDAYTGMQIAITAGTGSGQTNYIIAYDGDTRVATVEVPWITVPDGTSQYRVFVNGIPQFLVRLENTGILTPALTSGVTYSDVPFNDINSYFCVPENEELIAYWDMIEDRLFKIRHCMNIQGQVRTLALFEPPINPRDLINAARAGQSTQSVASHLSAAIPNYRFSTIIEKAIGLTSTTIQLGASLLSALEKKDAEALALLRTTQERALLDLTTYIKEQQIDQQTQMKLALEESLKSAQKRYEYYTELIAKGLSAGEIENIVAMTLATLFNAIGGVIKTAASIGYAVPQAGSPFAMTYGGEQIGASLNAASGAFEVAAIIANFDAQLSLTMANYERREAEWQLQADLSGYDEAQINYQIAATDAMINIANRDLQVHLKTIEQNLEMEAFLKDKFTNEELYQWMSVRLSTVYFQTYSLALELARSAQRAYQFELNSNQTFVNFTYWDSLRKGLLAGEGLMLALNQMDKAYLDNNSRTLEIEKTVSLLQLNPIAVMSLIENGECVFELSERLFDQDYPGHYARKIASIMVSIPTTVGPYQNLHATLTQLSNQTIIKPDVNAVNFLLGGSNATLPGPDTLRSNWWINQQIALSKGMSDSGMFELNFNDSRYLPFENTGAVSSWRLSMPKAANRIDYSNISDVVIQLRYTALDGGSKFRQDVVNLDAMQVYGGSDFFLMAQSFSSQWYTFLNQPTNPNTQTLEFVLANLVPPQIENAMLTGFFFQLIVPEGMKTMGSSNYITLSLANGQEVPFNLNRDGIFASTFQVTPDMVSIEGNTAIRFTLADTPSDLKLDTQPRYLNPAVIQNMVLILLYKGEMEWR